MDQLHRLDATGQAALIRQRQVKPEELVAAAIARIERLNPRLGAVVQPQFEAALAAARAPLPDGPFVGVPFLLKDLGAFQAGVPLTSGSRMYQRFVPNFDSLLVTRYKQAGLVILGKSSTPEFGLLPTTEPKLFGPCRNPWSPDHSAGGSSGGAAAAVAAGLVPVAHASDGGGSIRIPASCCGLFGLKPTRGRISLAPVLGDSLGGLSIPHVITRSVRDSAALLDATEGPAPGDPYFAPPPIRTFTQEVGANPGRLRIAFSTKAPTGVAIHPDCVTAVERTARLCADLGHEVVEATPTFNAEALLDAFTKLWAAGCAWGVNGGRGAPPATAPLTDLLEPLTLALYEMGQRVSAPEYLAAVTVMQQISRQVAAFFLGFDLWLTPVTASPPPQIGHFESTSDAPLTAFWRAVDYCPFTPLANVTGQPAMSVPLHWTADGLPVGSHFMGRYGDEATLFRLAAQLEQAQPWARRWPALATEAPPDPVREE